MGGKEIQKSSDGSGSALKSVSLGRLSGDEAVPTDQNVLLCVLSPFISKERSMAIQTFVQDDTDAPPVASAIVRGSLHNLRRHVLAGSYD